MKTILLFILSLALLPLTAAAGSAGMDSLLPPYFKAHNALSQDDLPATQAAAKNLAEAAKSQPEMDEKSQLSGLSLKVAEAPDLKTARTEFQQVTNALNELVKTEGTAGHEHIYLMSCPMAHGGEGGTWLQTQKKVANPYFGKSMLGCGGVKKDYPASAPASKEQP